MKIEAKITFRNGRIMEILRTNSLTIKDLSNKCGWKYSTLAQFIRFGTFANKSNFEDLYNLLKSLDNTLEYSEIFPKGWQKLVNIFRPRTSIQDIPTEKLLASHENLMIDYNDIEAKESIEFTYDFEKFAKKVKKFITKRQWRILCLYYGLEGEREHSLVEIGEKANVTKQTIGIIKINTLRKIFRKQKRLPNPCPDRFF